jgi:hypothetical protein
MEIPAVLIAQVMGYLPLTDRMEARGMSRSWRQAIDGFPFLWRSWIFNDFTFEPPWGVAESSSLAASLIS